MGYPVPNRINEKGNPSGPVMEVSEEVRLAMIAKYNNAEPTKSVKKPAMFVRAGTSEMSQRGAETRRKGNRQHEFLKAVAAGLTIADIERRWGMKKNSIFYWVKKWGYIGITQKKARELIDNRG